MLMPLTSLHESIYLIDDVVNENKYDNGDRDHNDGFDTDLEILRLLPVDFCLKAAVLEDGVVEVHCLPAHNVFPPDKIKAV